MKFVSAVFVFGAVVGAVVLGGCMGATIDLNTVSPNSELVVTPHKTPTRVQIVNQGPGSIAYSVEENGERVGEPDVLAPGAMDLPLREGRSVVIRAADPGWGQSPLIRLIIDNGEGYTMVQRAIAARMNQAGGGGAAER